MTLRDWLKSTGTRQAQFAAMVGVSQGFIADLCSGKKEPSLRIAREIKAATEGAVDYLSEESAA